MKKLERLDVRVDDDLRARIKAELARSLARSRALRCVGRITEADVVRKLLERALELAEAEAVDELVVRLSDEVGRSPT